MDREQAEREIRARVQTVSLNDDLVLTRVLGCPKMYLRKADYGFAHHVMLDGHWELWLTLFMARLIKPGMKVIDVGANFGYYSLLMALSVGSTGKVVAIEPNPTIAEILSRTLDLNGYSWVKLVARAASATEHQLLTLFQPKNEPKNTAVVPDNWPPDAGTIFRTQSTTIDAVAAELGGVDFIKIDAEGAEFDIIDGMQKTIEQYRPMIIIEYNAVRYKDPGDFLAKFSRYTSPKVIDYYGNCSDISKKELLNSSKAEDKLLFFE